MLTVHQSTDSKSIFFFNGIDIVKFHVNIQEIQKLL